jgi:hypothetical protein
MPSHGAIAAHLLVRRGDLTQLQLEQPCADADLPLSPGQVRLRVGACTDSCDSRSPCNRR